ncbi:MAG: hypothetical protein IKQ07_04565 [Bacteroidaceae bacterium]|nr:hypothetical protein [Bacteroidaceae bacterium]MBR6141468.1 hypothetical protein [Bacteroidaceae bacterium]
MCVYNKQGYQRMRGGWSQLNNKERVEALVYLYEELDDGQKDEFLRETGNP